MKKLLYLSFSLAIVFLGCSKKDNEVKPPVVAATPVTIEDTVYHTVVIGNQTWTSENYRGPGGVMYGNDTINWPLKGKLYTFLEAATVVLPTGWRLPSQSDYNKMLTSLGGVDFDGTVQSSVAITLMSKQVWNGSVGTNSTGFSAIPGGAYIYDPNNPIAGGYTVTGFTDYGSIAFFTTSTLSGDSPVCFQINCPDTYASTGFEAIPNSGTTVIRTSVRFVKDN